MASHDANDRMPSRRRALLTIAGGVAAIAAIAWLRHAAHRSAPGDAQRLRDTRMPLYYTNAYVGAAHAFETTRKARWLAESLAGDPIPGIGVRPNAPLGMADLLRCHDAHYIEAVHRGEPRDLAQSQGFDWDPGLWPMVLASNGGMVAAALAAREHGVAGALASGMHHARRDRGAGFCTFNGLAIAALVAIEAGARRVLILDLDAHCGGGTHSLLGTHPAVHQLDLAVHPFDRYSPAGANTLDLVTSASHYLPTLEQRLAELDGEAFDLCLYNAGMDPHEGCAVGGLPGMDSGTLGERERRVFTWCRARKLPVAFALAGGYLGPGLDQAGVVALHRLTLVAAANPTRL